MKSRLLTTGLMLATAALLAAPLAGCRGERSDATPRHIFPDMDDQRRWDEQESQSFFADGRTGRITPEGAVPFGAIAADLRPASEGGLGDEAWAMTYVEGRASMASIDDGVYRGVTTGIAGDEVFLDYIPVEVTREMLDHGRDMYNIYCVACHGYEGDGKGMVGQKWAYLPANLTSATYRDRSADQGKDGYLFDVILNGLWSPDGSNRMPGYGHALSEMDGWAVVAYVRALQRSRGVAWSELPAEDKARLGQPTGEGSTNGGDS